ncbi:hypothetical protein GGF43_006478, partial [Coemansia sp. RSA 2618]
RRVHRQRGVSRAAHRHHASDRSPPHCHRVWRVSAGRASAGAAAAGAACASAGLSL